MEPIRTTSGKTAKARLADLRLRRNPTQKEQIALLILKLDAISDQSYSIIRMMRDHGNALRLLAIDGKQTVAKLRKLDNLDVEL